MRTAIDRLFSPSRISTCFQSCVRKAHGRRDVLRRHHRCWRQEPGGTTYAEHASLLLPFVEVPRDADRRMNERRGIDTRGLNTRRRRPHHESGNEPLTQHAGPPVAKGTVKWVARPIGPTNERVWREIYRCQATEAVIRLQRRAEYLLLALGERSPALLRGIHVQIVAARPLPEQSLASLCGFSRTAPGFRWIAANETPFGICPANSSDDKEFIDERPRYQGQAKQRWIDAHAH